MLSEWLFASRYASSRKNWTKHATRSCRTIGRQSGESGSRARSSNRSTTARAELCVLHKLTLRCCRWTPSESSRGSLFDCAWGLSSSSFISFTRSCHALPVSLLLLLFLLFLPPLPLPPLTLPLPPLTVGPFPASLPLTLRPSSLSVWRTRRTRSRLFRMKSPPCMHTSGLLKQPRGALKNDLSTAYEFQ
jgi:hypothetical protein